MVADQLRVGQGGCHARVKGKIPVELPEGSVEAVRARLCGHYDLEGVLARLSREIRCLDRKLADRVDIWKDDPLVVRRVHRVQAVDGEACLIVALPRSLNRVLAREAADVGEPHTRHQVYQLDGIPAVERKVTDLSLIDEAFDRRLLGLDQLDAALDRNLLARGADLEYRRYAFLLREGQLQLL